MMIAVSHSLSLLSYGKVVSCLKLVVSLLAYIRLNETRVNNDNESEIESFEFFSNNHIYVVTDRTKACIRRRTASS